MKVYSDILTEDKVRRAFASARSCGADIWMSDIRTWKPRGHAYGTEFWAESHHGTKASAHWPLADSGNRRNAPRAASWSAYGWLIAILFRDDPDARIGCYDGAAVFVAKVEQEAARRPADPAFLAALTAAPEQYGTYIPSPERQEDILDRIEDVLGPDPVVFGQRS